MERLNKIHINYKAWGNFKKMAKENGINTFAELEMYCRVWDIKSYIDLSLQIVSDHIEAIYENYKKGVEQIGNDNRDVQEIRYFESNIL